MTERRVADATAVIDLMKGKPRYRQMLGLYRKTQVAQSCVSDLRQADHMIKALSDILSSPRKVGSVEREATEAALLAGAIQLYARATHTAANRGDRGSIDIRSRLSADQLVDHKRIAAARVKAMAHVYSNENLSGVRWHTDNMFFVETDVGWRIASATRRIQLDKEMLQTLRRQIPIAMDAVHAVFLNHVDALGHALKDSGLTEPMIEQALIDPVEQIGEAAASMLRSTDGSGYASIWE